MKYILPLNYDQEITNFPLNLKKIICCSSYKFINKNSNIKYIN